MGDIGTSDRVEASPVDLDVIVVGAGISGIDIAYRLQERCPDKSYTILEARDSLGGTWDLFKYPGIRSDSDLHTFGYSWRPWRSKKTIAEAKIIKDYLIECVEEFGIDKKIQYRHKLVSANWSTAGQAWSLKVDVNGEQKTLTSRFLFLATGYYDYYQPLKATIPGIDKFEGPVIHPQFWPEDLDYTGKEVAIIGSGATAITLLPNVAQKASHVTMIQRSPSYIVSLPQVDKLSEFQKRWLPESWALKLTRLRYIALPFLFFKFCRAFPNAAKSLLQKGAEKQLPANVPVKPHFDPSYKPWDQRLCVCPDGDFYKALSSGAGSVVTGHIDTVTEKSIIMKDSNQVLHPDIIITATGLKIQIAGGAAVYVDGQQVKFADKHLWKASLVESVPNLSLCLGYTNASWTLGSDATALQFTRIVNSMDKHGQTSVVPVVDPQTSMEAVNVLNLNSTYITKAQGDLPKAGSKRPWLPREVYFLDLWEAQYGDLNLGLKYT